VLAGAAVFVALVASVAAITLSGGTHSSGGSQSTAQELLGRAESQSAANALSSESADGSGHGFGTSAPGRAVGQATTGSSTISGSAAKAATPGASTPATSGGIAAESTSAPAANAATAPAIAAPAAKPAGPPTINISSNIAFSPSPNNSACSSAPTGATCTNDAIAALNHARAVLGIAAYNIPANFVSMTPSQQLLVLSNLDRAVFGLQQIAGLNSTLNTAAQQGVTNGGDPIGVDVGSAQWQTWGSNWASGYPNAAYTYYAWMYDDGLGSSNGDCTASNSSGCWGHRLNTLHNFGSNVQIGMGVGASGTTFTELYESFAASASVSYLPAP
jgi:hypothetical protein